MGIWRCIKKVRITAICGIKVIKNSSSQELMNLLGLRESLNRLGK